jgi:two-component system, NtrC family, sensor histidine kinase HydH
VTSGSPISSPAGTRRAPGPGVGYDGRGKQTPLFGTWNHTVQRPLAFEELQRELLDRIYRFMMQLRFVIAPLPIIIGGTVSVLDHQLWRRITLVTVFILAVVLSIVEDLRVKKHGKPDLKRVALVVGAVLQPVIAIATGGVLSPVVMAMLLITFMASTLLEKHVSRILVTLQVAELIVAAWLEYSQILGCLVPDPFRTVTNFAPSPVFVLVWASVAAVFFFVTHALGLRIQVAFGDLLLRTMRTRDETLRMHQEQLSDLTQLSGEIAHELKNPLASVKGLAALLAKRSAGDEPEALTVLRREVDRMQAILEEFLNFSRPLVPLNSTSADLGSITRDVCALHAGMTEVREITIDLEASGPVEVQCDPRKVHQILVNLFQNALDATAARGNVSIRVHALGDCAEVIIDDSGAGLDPAIGARVFEAGVTNKLGGSGLGLNVARGLARQHGGDVLLTNRPEGGCRATLRLPYVAASRNRDSLI